MGTFIRHGAFIRGGGGGRLLNSSHQVHRRGVCGIRDQRGETWDHSSGIRDHRPWDRYQ